MRVPHLQALQLAHGAVQALGRLWVEHRVGVHLYLRLAQRLHPAGVHLHPASRA